MFAGLLTPGYILRFFKLWMVNSRMDAAQQLCGTSDRRTTCSKHVAGERLADGPSLVVGPRKNKYHVSRQRLGVHEVSAYPNDTNTESSLQKYVRKTEHPLSDFSDFAHVW